MRLVFRDRRVGKGIRNCTYEYIIFGNSLYFNAFFHDKIKLKKEEYIIIIIYYIIFLIVVLLSIAMSRNVDFSLIWQKTFLILDMLMFIANIIVLK